MLVAGLLTGTAAAGCGGCGAGGPVPATLRVTGGWGGLPRLTDAAGRAVLLHGVAVTALVQYGPGYAENPPAGPADFAEMAALGLDAVRLPVSWSRIAPAPGRVDSAYLGLVRRTTEQAWRAGLWVVLDMHVDRYNRRLAPRDEADGAPNWATRVPSGCPAQPDPAGCQRLAWDAFWADRPVAGRGLQERYVEALLALSRAVRAAPGVAGIELMNNPSPGDGTSPSFELTRWWPFVRRAVARLRDDGERRPLWVDRSAAAEQSDALPPELDRGPVAHDGGLVLAPHDYAGVFSPPPWPAGGSARVAGWYAQAVRQAAGLGTALVVGEWGAQGGGPWESLLTAGLAAQERYGLGACFWVWKQRHGFYDWQLVNVDGGLRGDSVRAQLLSRPHPVAVPGRLVTSSTDPSAGVRAVISGPGGEATFWGGTQVRSGGPSSVTVPFTHATVDGRPAAVRVTAREFRNSVVDLRGALVAVRLPGGRHTVTLAG